MPTTIPSCRPYFPRRGISTQTTGTSSKPGNTIPAPASASRMSIPVTHRVTCQRHAICCRTRAIIFTRTIQTRSIPISRACSISPATERPPWRCSPATPSISNTRPVRSTTETSEEHPTHRWSRCASGRRSSTFTPPISRKGWTMPWRRVAAACATRCRSAMAACHRTHGPLRSTSSMMRVSS